MEGLIKGQKDTLGMKDIFIMLILVSRNLQHFPYLQAPTDFSVIIVFNF